MFVSALRASCSLLRRAHHLSNRGHCFFLRFAPRARAFAAQTLLMEYAFFFAFCHCFFLPSPSFKFELTKNKTEQNLFALRSRLLFAIVFVERDKHVLFFLSPSRVAFFICNFESCI